MFKILLVDDEPLFSEFLQEIIDWKEFGCRICGIAEDGETALEKIRKEKPDIIFLDINIPIVNGIEVLKTIREEHLETQVVIVSAHNDFQFAQTAIKNGVADYLLKPFNKKEFLEALHHCMELVKTTRGSFLRNCMEGKEHLIGKHAAVVFIKNVAQEELYRIGETIDSDFGSINVEAMYYFEKDTIIFACNCEKICEEELYYFFTKYAEQDTIIAIGDINQNIAVSFANANKALEKRIINNEDVIQYSEQKENEGYSGGMFSENDFTRLIGCLNQKDEKGITTMINKIFSLDGKQQISFLYLMSVLSFFTLSMAKHFDKTRIDVEELLLKHTSMKKDISKTTDPEVLSNNIREYIYELYDECAVQTPYTKQRDLVNKINKYIKENYNQKGFTLEKMATELLFENSYMRRVYKNETGTTILKSLEDYRIKKAKKLLSTRQYKHSEIAELNGFGDQYYFSKRFKQIVGCTPSEYEVRKNDE